MGLRTKSGGVLRLEIGAAKVYVLREYRFSGSEDAMPLARSHHHSPARKATRLNLRASTQQDALIRKAAESVGRSVTEFVLDSACANAEHVLADQNHFVLDAASWKRFMAALDQPAASKPRLKKLLSEPSVLERS